MFHCRVVFAGTIVEESTDAGCRIFVCGVADERAGSNRRVEFAGVDAVERQPTNCCIRNAGCEAKKGILPFCRVGFGIAAIRRRTDRLR